MEELLILVAGPFDFADAGVEPFCPASLALFCGFPGEKRGHALPLVQTVFRDGGFENFVLDICPDAALDDGHGEWGGVVWKVVGVFSFLSFSEVSLRVV